MRKYMIHLAWALPLAALALLFSCNDETSLTTPEEVENFTVLSVQGLDSMGNCGRHGAYELVFPVTIEFPNGDTALVESYEELFETIRTWKYENPDAEGRPTFVFPIELIAPDGTVVTIASADELAGLRMGPFPFRPGPRFRHQHQHGGHCFRIVFPVTLVFPDGDTDVVDNPRELQQSIRQWHRDNPDVTERPHFQFPIDVTLRDGTVVTVNSQDELEALKEDCRD